MLENYCKAIIDESVKNGSNVTFMIVWNSIDHDTLFDNFIDNL